MTISASKSSRLDAISLLCRQNDLQPHLPAADIERLSNTCRGLQFVSRFNGPDGKKNKYAYLLAKQMHYQPRRIAEAQADLLRIHGENEEKLGDFCDLAVVARDFLYACDAADGRPNIPAHTVTSTGEERWKALSVMLSVKYGNELDLNARAVLWARRKEWLEIAELVFQDAMVGGLGLAGAAIWAPYIAANVCWYTRLAIAAGKLKTVKGSAMALGYLGLSAGNVAIGVSALYLYKLGIDNHLKETRALRDVVTMSRLDKDMEICKRFLHRGVQRPRFTFSVPTPEQVRNSRPGQNLFNQRRPGQARPIFL